MVSLRMPRPGRSASWVCAWAVGVAVLFLVSPLAGSGAVGAVPSALSAPAGLQALPLGPGSPVSPLTALLTPVFPTPIRHVIMIIEENKEWSEVWKYGPFQVSLAREYANLSQYYALHQASYSAYVAQTSGLDTTGGPKPTNAHSLADLTAAAGETWAEWTESAPKPCDRVSDSKVGYLTRHVPFIWYNDVYGNSSECATGVVPMSLSQMTAALSKGTDIPNFLLITPNEFDDGDLYHAGCAPSSVKNHTEAEENCTDMWLSKLLPSLFSDTALWDATAVLICYDQSATSDDSGGGLHGVGGGHVYASIVSPYSKGLSSSTAYTAFNMLTTSEYLLGLPGGTLQNDKWTNWAPIKGAFS
jgi:hypothetical protein